MAYVPLVGEEIVQFPVKTLGIDIASGGSLVKDYTGKPLQCLNVHIFIKRYLRELRPKRDVEGQREFEGPIDILMGQDAHRCCGQTGLES